MNLENLAYALAQVVHNFGAVAVVGGALFGRWPQFAASSARHRLGWVILVGWAAQALSGAGFGAVSFAYYGQFPDIHGVAIAALNIKIVCAVAGFGLALAFLHYRRAWPEARQALAFTGLAALGIVALTAAAFLRWFS